MKCPECKSGNLGVVGSVKTFLTINHRYLRCYDCGTTFQTTEEIIEKTINSQFYLNYAEPEEKKETEKERGKASRKVK